MATYNLSDNISKSFAFEIDGKVYDFRRPLVKELKANQEIQKELDAASTDEEKQAVADKMQQFVYGLITPVDHSTSIEEALDASPINVLQEFNKMVEAELSAK